MTPNPANCELTIFPFFSVFAVHVFVGLFESNPIESPPITQKHWITICVSLPALLACSSQSSPETVYPLYLLDCLLTCLWKSSPTCQCRLAATYIFIFLISTATTVKLRMNPSILSFPVSMSFVPGRCQWQMSVVIKTFPL